MPHERGIGTKMRWLWVLRDRCVYRGIIRTTTSRIWVLFSSPCFAEPAALPPSPPCFTEPSPSGFPPWSPPWSPPPPWVSPGAGAPVPLTQKGR